MVAASEISFALIVEIEPAALLAALIILELLFVIAAALVSAAARIAIEDRTSTAEALDAAANALA